MATVGFKGVYQEMPDTGCLQFVALLTEFLQVTVGDRAMLFRNRVLSIAGLE